MRLARQVVLDAGITARLVADRLPLIRHARRQVVATLGPEVVVPPAEALDAAVSLAILEDRRHPPPVQAVVEGYRALLELRGLIDFDGLLAVALARLRTDDAVRSRWQARYDHVLVDEFQDVDAAQMELVGLLAEPQRNLFVVGDDDQTIYAWRLADVRRILEFPVRYPDARRVILETNYRCPARVVVAANRLIATNVERVPKRLRAAPIRTGTTPGAVLWTWPPPRIDPGGCPCGRVAGDRRGPRTGRGPRPDARRARAALPGPPAGGRPACHHHPDPVARRGGEHPARGPAHRRARRGTVGHAPPRPDRSPVAPSRPGRCPGRGRPRRP